MAPTKENEKDDKNHSRKQPTVAKDVGGSQSAKLTLVKVDQKAPFTIATTLRCTEGRYFIPGIAPFYAWSVPYNAECWARWHQVPFFESLVWHYLGSNPGLPYHWWTLGPKRNYTGRPWRTSKRHDRTLKTIENRKLWHWGAWPV